MERPTSAQSDVSGTCDSRSVLSVPVRRGGAGERIMGISMGIFTKQNGGISPSGCKHLMMELGPKMVVNGKWW